MADNANIATDGEGNPSRSKTADMPRDVRDNRDDCLLEVGGSDAAIQSAWACYLAARDTLDALPDHYGQDEQTALEAPYWDECYKAEAAILAETAATPAGAAIKIRIALTHMLTDRTHDNALRSGDLAALGELELEWSERVLVSAIQSLESMGA